VLLTGFVLVSSTARKAGPEIGYDVVVYGGTASGVMAAISASRAGMRTALVEPGHHLGGMVSGGLSVTDVGDPDVIGGLTAAFYSTIREEYRIPSLAWRYEPHVAEAEFDREVKQAGVTVYLGQRLRAFAGVDKSGSTITDLVTESGLALAARIFIDSSYEGDLLAQAGVTFVIGGHVWGIPCRIPRRGRASAADRRLGCGWFRPAGDRGCPGRVTRIE